MYAPITEFNGVKGLQTVFPSYVREDNSQLLENTSVDVNVIHIGGEFNLDNLNLKTCKLYELPEELKYAFDLDALLNYFKSNYRPDGREIAEWMCVVASENAMLDTRCREYNENSWLRARAGDGYIPGVSIGGAWFQRVLGSYFRRHGTVCHFPGGQIRMMPMQNVALISRNWLGFASTGKPYWWNVQYHALLGHFFSLASKITKSFGVPRSWSGNLPVFLAQTPPNCRVLRINYTIYSEDNSNMYLTFRDPSDFTKKIDSYRINLRSGENRIECLITNYSRVPDAVHHLEFDGGRKVITKYTCEKVK